MHDASGGAESGEVNPNPRRKAWQAMRSRTGPFTQAWALMNRGFLATTRVVGSLGRARLPHVSCTRFDRSPGRTVQSPWLPIKVSEPFAMEE